MFSREGATAKEGDVYDTSYYGASQSDSPFQTLVCLRAQRKRSIRSWFAVAGPLKISPTGSFCRTAVSQVPLVAAEGRVPSREHFIVWISPHAHSPKMGTLTVVVRHACQFAFCFPSCHSVCPGNVVLDKHSQGAVDLLVSQPGFHLHVPASVCGSHLPEGVRCLRVRVLHIRCVLKGSHWVHLVFQLGKKTKSKTKTQQSLPLLPEKSGSVRFMERCHVGLRHSSHLTEFQG